ncbi:universal stress protein [Sphingomonas sp.]|uniref:universal stress protein n=1 Tax=Sphingomonas sp. TaxID=28214 RepID=UPI001D2616BA|nr:universal stress protein [Sphingomonas sp.]MBX9797318.1 universal stress protein [Sphingomonas sp.]
MRIYLVVIDDSAEAEVALRFAARRATKTGGSVEILAVVPSADFVPWGGVQATIEAEAREHAEAVVQAAAGTLLAEAGLTPTITVETGEPHKLIREAIRRNPDIAALVLASAASGPPGPLISHFAGAEATSLGVPLMIVPGNLSPEAIDRLS